jgi:CIC family chloride channel protein
MGSRPEFVVIPTYFVQSNFEYLFYIILGLLVGIFAVFFIKIFYKTMDIFESLKINKLFKPIIGMGLVGIIGIMYPQVLSNGYEYMEKILNNELIGPVLIIIFFLKILATSLTLGSGGAGGVFAPSMFIGAALGGLFGWTVNYFFPAHTAPAGLYALVGMGGFLAAATHAPMTAIFLLFEITGKYEVIIPIMFTCVAGTSLARWLNKETIDTFYLAKMGINLHAGKEVNLLKSIKVKESMVNVAETIPENMHFKDLINYIPKSKHISFPIVDSDNLLTGIISIQDFRGIAYEKGLEDLLIAKDIATIDVLTVTPEDDLNVAMQKIGTRNIDQLPVVSEDNPRKIVGMLSRRDIISSYNKAIEKRLILEKKDEIFGG